MLHTLCGCSLIFHTTYSYCIEYFVMDMLMMEDDEYCVGAMAPNTNMEDGTAIITVLVTWFSMQCTGDGNAMAVGTGLEN